MGVPVSGKNLFRPMRASPTYNDSRQSVRIYVARKKEIDFSSR
jgi:hypothetical protein